MDLVCILHDAIDHVAERRRPLGPSQPPGSSGTASGSASAAAQPLGSSRTQQVGYAAFGRTPRPDMDGNEYPEAELPLVDPLKDDWNLWALLDEGCNSTCHGEQWRIHAQAVLKRRGYAPQRHSDAKSNFSGIGEATCTGRWRFPIGLTMEPSAVPVHGTLDSAELADTQTPMLFSLPAQIGLGLIKDMRACTCSLREFPGEHLNLSLIHISRAHET